MYFSTELIVAALAAVAVAVPAALTPRQLPICSGLNSNGQCCAVDVLGIADLDCEDPPRAPMNNTDFHNICNYEGRNAMCCTLPILEQALLCETVPAS